MTTLLASGGGVKNGAVQLEQPGRMNAPGQVRSVVAALLNLVEALPSGPVPRMLLDNVQSDEPGVRLRSLELLARDFPSEPETRVAGEAALVDREPAIRLLAAKLVRGERGKTALAGLLEDHEVPLEVLAHAVAACGDTRDRAFADPICALAKRLDPGLSEAVATALGKLGDPRAEPALLRLLARDVAEVRRAAAIALGLTGSVRAVEPLLEAGGDAARDAVRRIQARLGDAGAGRLSLAQEDATAGALSPAADEGQLSLLKSKA